MTMSPTRANYRECVLSKHQDEMRLKILPIRHLSNRGNPTSVMRTIGAWFTTRLPPATMVALLGAACADVWGIEEPKKIDFCKVPQDCPAMQTCQAGICVQGGNNNGGAAGQPHEPSSGGSLVGGTPSLDAGAQNGGMSPNGGEGGVDVANPPSGGGTVDQGGQPTISGGGSSFVQGGTSQGGVPASTGDGGQWSSSGGTGQAGFAAGAAGAAGEAGEAGAAGAAGAGGVGNTCNDVPLCNLYQPLVCTSGSVTPSGAECSVRCRKGICEPALSCAGTGTCAGSSSCCESIWIPGGGPYSMGAGNPNGEDTFERTVSGFYLDRFEVTVGRFREFAHNYGSNRIPADASGANPHIADSGWKEQWNGLTNPKRGDEFVVPRTSEKLTEQLTASSECTWTKASDLPITCVNWFVAFAFCIWDNGRLPTEAEWNYAASAGKGYPYPWSVNAADERISPDLANYLHSDPLPVGSFPQGESAFKRALDGHSDLAGNVGEWVADGVNAEMPRDNRLDYMVPWTSGSDKRVVRGGAFLDASPDILSGTRVIASALLNTYVYGFRCAHDELEPNNVSKK